MAGYRTWGDKDRLSESDVNTYLMGQVVARFADADDRDAQMGGVVAGQVCYLISTDTFMRVSASGTWVDLIPRVRAGATTLAGVTTVVPCPSITTTAIVQLTAQNLVGAAVPSALAVSSRSVTDKTFTITCSQPEDRSAVGWQLIEPTT